MSQKCYHFWGHIMQLLPFVYQYLCTQTDAGKTIPISTALLARRYMALVTHLLIINSLLK